MKGRPGATERGVVIKTRDVIMTDVDEKRMGVVVKKRRGVIWSGVASKK